MRSRSIHFTSPHCTPRARHATLLQHCFAAYETVRPLLHLAGCVDSAEERARRQRRKLLENGAKFQRAMGTGRIAAALTFGALGTEPVFVRLENDNLLISVLGNAKKELETIRKPGTVHHLGPPPRPSGHQNSTPRPTPHPYTRPHNLPPRMPPLATPALSTFEKAECSESTPAKFSLVTEGGRTLLELEAPNKRMADEYALAITEAVAEDARERGPVTAKSLATRKAHNVKREMEASTARATRHAQSNSRNPVPLREPQAPS